MTTESMWISLRVYRSCRTLGEKPQIRRELNILVDLEGLRILRRNDTTVIKRDASRADEVIGWSLTKTTYEETETVYRGRKDRGVPEVEVRVLNVIAIIAKEGMMYVITRMRQARISIETQTGIDSMVGDVTIGQKETEKATGSLERTRRTIGDVSTRLQDSKNFGPGMKGQPYK